MTEFADTRPLPRAAARGIRYDLIVKRLELLAMIVGVWWIFSLTLPHFVGHSF